MLDEKGFYRKTYEEILAELNETAIQLFGEDINTEETSTLGKFIRIVASQFEALWEDIEGAYYSGFISTARGVSLDRLATTLAIARYDEANAKAKVKFTGTANYTIPVGFIVATKTDIQFTTTEEVTLDEKGEGTTEVMCLTTGNSGNVGKNTITVIVNPNTNVTSVNNEDYAYDGRERETDPEFRSRMMLSIGSTAGTTMDAIQGTLLNLSEVKSVTIIENDTMETDAEGRPPHSFEAFIYGGEDEEIAQVIFDKKPIGIQTVGDIEKQVKDISNNEHTIKFSRPVKKDIYVRTNITASGSLEDVSSIKSTILSYIGGTDEDGTVYPGLNMGEDVILSKILSLIVSIEGVEDAMVTLSSNGVSYAQNNIVVERNEIAETGFDNITVEVIL